MEDQFLTLASVTEGYYMERGSKFMAYACPVSSEEESQFYLQTIIKDHPKARHYCTAIRLFPDASLERSSDDGEPSGSAGKPILGQIIKNNLTNVFLVVVRYFGGTKLGIPGLIEAYKTSAANAIEAGIILEKTVNSKVLIRLSYERFPLFLNHCKQNGIPVLEETFSDKATMGICVRKSSSETALINTLHQFSHMDFKELDAYVSYLEMDLEILPGDYIL